MIKKYTKIFLIVFVVISITAKAFCFTADVQDISGPKYFPAVKQAISSAEQSINIAMFLIEIPERKGTSKVQELVDELIIAEKRGVKVSVILDQNVDFVNQRHESDWLGKVRSFRAYKQLREAGVDAHYDEISTYTHAKAIVIDQKIVILGSTNWTQTSLERSIETDVLIDSPEAAQSYLEYFKTIEIDESIEKYIEFLKQGIAISNNFMQSSKLAPQMMKQHDERSLEIYLFLLKEASNKKSLELKLDYDVIAEYLGIDKKMNEIAYRRQISKVLRKLEEKYKLIKADLQYAKDAKVMLLDNKAEVDKEFHLPKDYFNFGWNKELSMRAKFCYLINLSEVSISDTQPYWTKSAKDITKDYGKISQDVIFKGMGELRRRKLIEVMYDDLTDKDYTKRSPKLYKLLELYSPEKLDLDLAKLSEQYGEKEYKQARKYANIVFEEYNPQIIEDIILKTKQYGPKKIKEAFAIVAKKNIDNPKRKYSYVVGILENWGTGANKQKIDFGTMVQVLAYTEIDEMKRAFDKWSDRETVNKLSKITITDDHIKELYKEFQEVLVTPPNPETYTEYSIDNGEEALEKAEQLGSKMQNLFLALSKKDFVKYGKLVGIMKEVLYIDVRHVPLAIKHDNSRNIYWYELHYKGVEMAGEEYERLFKVQL